MVPSAETSLRSQVPVVDRAVEVLPPALSLSREQVVDRILALTPGVTPEFLATFDTPALADFLERLSIRREIAADATDGRRWVRRTERTAIVVHEPAE
jgi:hypothetical protein